jgi:signal recognition particle subunit SRP54
MVSNFMFDALSQKFSALYEKITSKRLNESVLAPLLVEVEDALLQADVPYDVVVQFLADVKADIIGEVYPKHLTAQQAFIKIMNERMIKLMQHDQHELVHKQPPLKVLVTGLQGSGKTTSIAKLALHLIKKKKKVLLVSLDIYRPAAREQLMTLAKKVGADCFDDLTQQSVISLLESGLKRSKFYDVLIVDTAGRTQLDNQMMIELQQVATQLQPHETLYVLDSMAGQESLNVASAFHHAVPLTGIIVTKLDSGARAGAMLGLKMSLGVPIKFISSGEQVDSAQSFNLFHPDRMAQRILGMGDMLSLIEQIEQSIDQEKAKQLQEKMMKTGEMSFEDMKSQLEQMRQLMSNQGGAQGLLKHLPGMGQLAGQISNEDADKALKHNMALLNSMTPKERKNPHLIQEGSRKRRISDGAGLKIADLNRLVKQLEQMNKFASMASKGKLQGLLRGLGGQMPAGFGR